MVKCPYVPPHAFDLDFPHLMLRARAAELKHSKGAGLGAQLSKTDRIGEASRFVLARNGVETRVVYPSCCGMPQFERGDIAKVAEAARRVAAEMVSWIDRGHAVIALTPANSER